MKYKLQCTKCQDSAWIRGHHEDDTNATVLSDHDWNWERACAHIKQGDYEIVDSEIEEE